MTTSHALLAFSVAVLSYVYGAYPLLLRVLVWIRGPRLVRRQNVTPRLSLLISAHNEATVIRRKVENALSLDYPREAFEIVVVSDGSTDETDAIVSEYADRGVRLARQPERRGKTAGLNRTVPRLAGEIVVFSDANAMYERDALRKLARNFADPAVGCVTGEARYLPGGEAAADRGERVYWNYEMHIKRLETALGSMVGGDGAIYAIRKSLWRHLPEDAINDFLNPLQIVAAGWRAIYEPEAVCYEEAAGGIRTEYRRRTRIVSRSWRAVFQAYEVLNPFHVGLFTWSVVSHKVLRWMSGIVAAIGVVALIQLYAETLSRWPLPSLACALVGGLVVAVTSAGRRSAAMFTYFAVINLASTVGVLKGTTGRVSGVWSTPREATFHTTRRAVGALVPVGPLFLVGSVLALTAAVWTVVFDDPVPRTALVFWGSVATLAYIYVGYPLILLVGKTLWRRSVNASGHEPTVCLFVAANDEAAVIDTKLRNALAIDYPPDRLEIVVASDGSVDGTNEIVRRFAPRVRLVELSPRRGKIAAINSGIKSVTSDIVVFSDANTFLDPGAVRALVANFADEQVGAVSGDVALVGERAALAVSEDLYYKYERWVQRAESEVGSMIGADGALYAIRRALFVPPENDTILDDMAIPMSVIRAGRRVIFEPAARALEQGSETAREEFARKSRVIAGAMQFLTRRDSWIPFSEPQVILSFISHKALRWLSPAFATSAFLSSAMLASASGGYAAVVAAQGVVLLLGLTGCVPALRRVNFVALAHYFCLVQAAAAVGFIRGLRGRQSVLWRRFVRTPAGQHVA